VDGTDGKERVSGFLKSTTIVFRNNNLLDALALRNTSPEFVRLEIEINEK